MFPTETQAIEYVARLEAEWELPMSGSYAVSVYADLAAQALDVVTDANRWTVWIEHDGSVYGEC